MNGVTLRPADAARDRQFLLDVYAATRDDVAALIDWSDDQKRAFLTQQFEAQDAYYRAQFLDASFDVVVVDGADAGRLYVERRDDEIRVLDIALLPAFRGRGIGRHLFQRLIVEAGARNVPVRIHVEKSNPARALYDALGFVVAGDVGMHWLMERPPTSPA